jgi:1,4-dihydroxy-2-naphthoyl-CoA synthase
MSDTTTEYVEETDIVTYESADGIAWISMNRPKYNNAQNGRMTYELDAAFMRRWQMMTLRSLYFAVRGSISRQATILAPPGVTCI